MSIVEQQVSDKKNINDKREYHTMLSQERNKESENNGQISQLKNCLRINQTSKYKESTLSNKELEYLQNDSKFHQRLICMPINTIKHSINENQEINQTRESNYNHTTESNYYETAKFFMDNQILTTEDSGINLDQPL